MISSHSTVVDNINAIPLVYPHAITHFFYSLRYITCLPYTLDDRRSFVLDIKAVSFK